MLGSPTGTAACFKSRFGVLMPFQRLLPAVLLLFRLHAPEQVAGPASANTDGSNAGSAACMPETLHLTTSFDQINRTVWRQLQHKHQMTAALQQLLVGKH